jgi:hypothetical protein
MLENVEVVLRPYDQAGREGGKEEGREDIAEKEKRGGWKKSRRGKPPSLSIKQGGAERLCWRPLTRNRREAGSYSAHPRITRER